MINNDDTRANSSLNSVSKKESSDLDKDRSVSGLGNSGSSSPGSSRGFAQSHFFTEACVEDSIFGDSEVPEVVRVGLSSIQEDKMSEKVTARNGGGAKRTRWEIVRHYAVKYFIPLQIGLVSSMIWANLSIGNYESTVNFNFGEFLGHKVSPLFIVNDLLMVFFFALAMVEVVLAVLPGGALHPPSKAVSPVIGTIGGMLGPVGIFFLAGKILGFTSSEYQGWGVPVATDISVSWLVATFTFGSAHPAVKFLLLLAVADDVGGLLIIAIFYRTPESVIKPIWLLLVLLGMALAFCARKFLRKYDHWTLYILLGGVPSWFGLFLSGIHPALALAPIIPFMERKEISENTSVMATEGSPSCTKENLEIPTSHNGKGALIEFDAKITFFVHFVLFWFALFNGGVLVSQAGGVTLAVVAGLVLGKTLGIFLFSAIAAAAGFRLPVGMKLSHLMLVGVISGIGLTVSLFVAGLAYSGNDKAKTQAKLGALLSLLAAPVALGMGKLMGIEKRWIHQ